jgi:MOSC domain-containing protein YiiM
MPEQMSEQRGRVEGIFLADAHGSPPRAVAVVVAQAGRGLEGDRHFDNGDSCHISLIEAEAIENMRAEYGFDLPPGDTRRQLVVRGVDLGDFIGRPFLVGDVQCEGEERCEPCDHLAGLVQTAVVLRALLHSGLRAKIVRGGTIRVGDTVQPSALVSKEAKPAI